MNKLSFITVILTLTCYFACLQPSTPASVKRSDLATTVHIKSKEELLKQLAKLRPETVDIASAKIKIASRTEDFAKTIDTLPMSEVDDDLAAWIETSMIAEMKGLGLSFLLKDSSDEVIGTYTNNAKLRFQTLTNEKGRLLLLKRNKLLISSKSYRDSLSQYLFAKLSTINSIKTDFKRPELSCILEGVLLARGADIGKEAKDPATSEIEDPFDFRSSELDSRIATLAMIRMVNESLDSWASISWFSFASIISPAYFEGDPYKVDILKDFEELKPKIEKLFQSCLIRGTDATEIDPECLIAFIKIVALNIRHDSDQTLNIKPNIKKPFVIFKNDSTAWNLVLRKDISLPNDGL